MSTGITPSPTVGVTPNAIPETPRVPNTTSTAVFPSLPVPLLPEAVVAAATDRFKQAQNLAHAALAVLSMLILAAQAVVETIHQVAPNLETGGVDWRLVAIAGGVLTVSKAIDSLSWTTILGISRKTG